MRRRRAKEKHKHKKVMREKPRESHLAIDMKQRPERYASKPALWNRFSSRYLGSVGCMYFLLYGNSMYLKSIMDVIVWFQKTGFTEGIKMSTMWRKLEVFTRLYSISQWNQSCTTADFGLFSNLLRDKVMCDANLVLPHYFT